MVQIELLNGKLSISSDENEDGEDELLKELNRVLCFTIAIYKRKLEKLQQRKLSELDEIMVNQKIKTAIAMIPIDEIRELINESDLLHE